MRFRFRLPPLDWTGPRDPLYQALLAFALGATLGLIAWLDQQYAGGDEAFAALSDISPVRGFLWNVLGTGALGLIVWALCTLPRRLGLRGLSRDIDETHAPHCAHRSLRVQARGRLRCTCRRERPPLKLIGGGRD